MTNNALHYLEESARRAPEKVAVIDESGSITYRGLHAACRRVGSALAAYVTPRTPVAVLMEKGIGALTAFWGIVSAGGFYTLLNPELPESRLAQIQRVLGAAYVVTDEDHLSLAEALFPPERILLLDKLLLAAENAPLLAARRSQMVDLDPLYANFTSGSTGIPKGVVVCHRSVLDFIDVFAAQFGFTGDDIFANQAPFDFDVSVKDIYTAAKVGATLVITPKRLFSRPPELLDWLCGHRITVMVWAVSALCLINTFHGLDYRTPETVRQVLFSGETMPLRHLRTWMEHLPEARFVNLYGPTEITCNCTYHILDRTRSYDEGIPIGRPFPNEDVFLLDENDAPVTVPGAAGEICVRGSALALGYWNAPEQTAAAFTPDPRCAGYPGRIYRTGDLGRYDAAGDLCFCGRRDFQIKYMGHRIELEEIERAVSAMDGVDRCCCVFDPRKNRLYGFFTGTAEGKALRQALLQQLPNFMVPSVLRPVDAFPLNKNGKIDRARLLD